MLCYVREDDSSQNHYYQWFNGRAVIIVALRSKVRGFVGSIHVADEMVGLLNY